MPSETKQVQAYFEHHAEIRHNRAICVDLGGHGRNALVGSDEARDLARQLVAAAADADAAAAGDTPCRCYACIRAAQIEAREDEALALLDAARDDTGRVDLERLRQGADPPDNPSRRAVRGGVT